MAMTLCSPALRGTMADSDGMAFMAGIHVAVVTAAGYPGKPDRYAARFKGLLDKMREREYPQDITDKFLVVGGECNYLFKVNVGQVHPCS